MYRYLIDSRCGSSLTCCHNIRARQLYKMSLFALTLHFPVSETKRSKRSRMTICQCTKKDQWWQRLPRLEWKVLSGLLRALTSSPLNIPQYELELLTYQAFSPDLNSVLLAEWAADMNIYYTLIWHAVQTSFMEQKRSSCTCEVNSQELVLSSLVPSKHPSGLICK